MSLAHPVACCFACLHAVYRPPFCPLCTSLTELLCRTPSLHMLVCPEYKYSALLTHVRLLHMQLPTKNCQLQQPAGAYLIMPWGEGSRG